MLFNSLSPRCYLPNYADYNISFFNDLKTSNALIQLKNTAETLLRKKNPDKSCLIVNNNKASCLIKIGNKTLTTTKIENLIRVKMDYKLKLDQKVTSLCKNATPKLRNLHLAYFLTFN